MIQDELFKMQCFTVFVLVLTLPILVVCVALCVGFLMTWYRALKGDVKGMPQRIPNEHKRMNDREVDRL